MQVALGLANELTGGDPADRYATLTSVLAFDPSSSAELAEPDVAGFVALAADLLAIFAALDRGDVDAAADTVNALLAASPAHPHLAKEKDGEWTVHHHPARADLVSSWTGICGESLARLIGEGYAARGGLCEAEDCRRAFLDTTRNGTRRFCSTTCQNRVKAAALRRRRAGEAR